MQTLVPPMPLSDATQTDRAGGKALALIALHDRSVDSAKGFARMVDKAEPSFRAIAERFHGLHERHAAELARLLSDRGIAPEGDGTFMGKVNEAVISFRALFDETDVNVMDRVRRGEDRVLQTFDEAIAELADDLAATRLHEMRSGLTTLLAETRHLG